MRSIAEIKSRIDIMSEDLLFKHQKKLDQVINRVKELSKRGVKAYIYHGTTNTTRAFNFKKDNIVDLSDFGEILEVDEKHQTITCEPNVPMDRLVEATLKYNLIPPVVMEFPGITVGGGISGGAEESSSFKYGLFHQTALEYELVLGNGDVLIASKHYNQDLFYGLAGALGSLAIITKVKLKLIEAKKFVKLEYVSVSSFRETAIKLKDFSADQEIDFIDGIMFEKNSGTLMIGKLTNNAFLASHIRQFTRAWDEWFYLHARNKAHEKKPSPDLVPIVDYLFRYDRGGFWMGEYYFKLFKIFPPSRFFKLLFNSWLKTRKLYKALHAGNMSQEYMIQDLCVPCGKAQAFGEFLDVKMGIYPLWFLPIKSSEGQDKMTPNYLHADLVINVGVWGSSEKLISKFYEKNRELEKFLAQIGGRKIFYAHSYYPQDEFWKIYNQSWYENLRKQYGAEKLFPDVFEKLFVKSQYRASISKGFFKFLISGEKLPVKN